MLDRKWLKDVVQILAKEGLAVVDVGAYSNQREQLDQVQRELMVENARAREAATTQAKAAANR